MKDIIKLLRVHHYIKNLLIFIPLFFAGAIFDGTELLKAFCGFLTFCLVSSSIYILNDIQDVEKDRMHPTKRNRPIASGRISIRKAAFLGGGCCILAFLLCLCFLGGYSVVYLIIYFVLNMLYSYGLKNIPITDIVILASGFVIRILYGGYITGVDISEWLYLVIVSGSLFMGLGKRRNELKQHKDTRIVLQYYSESFLDKNMYVCMALVIIFYSMWAVNSIDNRVIWTVPVVIIILMKYSLNIEAESEGDPVNVIFHDKILIILAVVYAFCISLLLYMV